MIMFFVVIALIKSSLPHMMQKVLDTRNNWMQKYPEKNDIDGLLRENLILAMRKTLNLTNLMSRTKNYKFYL